MHIKMYRLFLCLFMLILALPFSAMADSCILQNLARLADDLPSPDPVVARHIVPHRGWSDEQIRNLQGIVERRSAQESMSLDEAMDILRGPSENASPFRDRRRTTFFPEGVRAREILAEHAAGRSQLVGSNSAVHSFTVRYGNNEYRVMVCRSSLGCRQDGELIPEGNVVNVYPKCGPDIRRAVDLDTAAQILSENRNLRLSDFLELQACK